mmetsp:Transcript_46366/g.149473  ORF Transcript_46366/g.149473 Transcript_46366/m.149473 type:complete len:381 (+) Transcript_46366:1310-2452(+)
MLIAAALFGVQPSPAALLSSPPVPILRAVAGRAEPALRRTAAARSIAMCDASVLQMPERPAAEEVAERIRSRLTPEEEQGLALDMKMLRRWTATREELAERLQRAPSHFEWSVAIGFVGDERAFVRSLALLYRQRERLIVSNLPFVAHIAQRYRHCGVPIQDLIQEGTLGLISAAERYDPSYGCRFSTYSVHWIQMRIGRLASTSSRLIRLPVRAGERLRRVKQLRNLFMLREGRWPSDGELAEAAEITEGQLQTALRSGLDTVSLEAQMPAGGASGRGSATLTDMLPAPEGCDPADALAARDLRALLKQSLAGLLDPRDAKMMELLYALDEGEGRRTAEEVGVLFSVSAREVRRIEAKCLRKLQDQRQLVVRLRTYLES